jgi:hypothetical protein
MMRFVVALMVGYASIARAEPCHVKGRVFAHGRPVDHFAVAVVESAEVLIGYGITEVRQRDGSFDIAVPQCGFQDVVIGGPGFARQKYSGVDISGAADLGRIDLYDGRVVRGHVTDAAGKPLAHVPVRIGSKLPHDSNAMMQMLNGDYETVTAQDGSYEFTGVSRINIHLEPQISAGVAGSSSSGELALPDQQATTQDLVVLPVGIVRGDLGKPSGTRPHFVFLQAVSNRSLNLGGHADPNGHVEIDDVPIGDYDAFDDPMSKLRKRITVIAGTAVNVSFP